LLSKRKKREEERKQIEEIEKLQKEKRDKLKPKFWWEKDILKSNSNEESETKTDTIDNIKKGTDTIDNIKKGLTNLTTKTESKKEIKTETEPTTYKTTVPVFTAKEPSMGTLNKSKGNLMDNVSISIIQDEMTKKEPKPKTQEVEIKVEKKIVKEEEKKK